MSRSSSRYCYLKYAVFALMAVVLADFAARPAQARNPYRRNFFDAYPQAVGSRLDALPSNPQHCGVCHFDFSGGGARNPYGLAVEATDRSVEAILGLGGEDSDGDGFSNVIEILDPNDAFTNTPTFPGLTAGNVGQTSNIPLEEIQDYLTPVTGEDNEPPVVTIIFPNGGESLGSSSEQTIQWEATDNSGTVVAVSVYVSFDGGEHYEPLALGMPNTGTLTWFVQNRPATDALVRVDATDPSNNTGSGQSDDFFEIYSAATGRVPSTLRDFDQPGTQPVEAGSLADPSDCAACHGGYGQQEVEPYFNWQGSMMAQASIDPLLHAAIDIANQDAPESGDLCLRCHTSQGWLGGRSTPTDGSQMLATDLIGVSCDLCHRLVDPIYEPGVSPPEDEAILAELRQVPDTFALGEYVVDPSGTRRGPFADAVAPHAFLVSPFHQEAAVCGTCHDVSNPVFVFDPDSGTYIPNSFDEPAAEFGSHRIGPVERTYSEWFHSEYNTEQGVYAPEFGGNKDYVATCQDCHMRDVTGQGCNDPGAPVRDDLPLHDMTGGSAWLPGLLHLIDPGVNTEALQDGIARARRMLQLAADLQVREVGEQLSVKVTNNTGHKLPTGYPEGRRIWLNVRFYDRDGELIHESGAYDPNTAELAHDPEAKIYEVLPAVGENIADVVGLPAGTEFHFVLNNDVLKDNRIPPRGFTNAAYAEFGGAPVEAAYADGEYWDTTLYAIPSAALRAEVTLYYQSLSKEFVEFLRDNGTPDGAGQAMYDLWADNGKCPPEVMASVSRVIRRSVSPSRVTPAGNMSGGVTLEPLSPAP